MEINWILPARGRNGASQSSAARIGVTVNASQKPQSWVTLSESLMKEMRFHAGDKFLVGDAGDYIAVKRTTIGGFTASPSGKGKDARAKVMGKPVTSTIKFTSDMIKRGAEFARDEINVMDDGTILIPKSK